MCKDAGAGPSTNQASPGKAWNGVAPGGMRWPCPHLFCSCGEPYKGEQLVVYYLRREKANRVRPEISTLVMELTTAGDAG